MKGCELRVEKFKNINLFKQTYLPSAIDTDTLIENHREIKSQLASLRLFDLVHNCPTNAGILILCDGAKGAHLQAGGRCYADFKSLTEKIILKCR